MDSSHPTQNGQYENWLERFDSGDESAATEIVNVFYERLVRLAHCRLSDMPPQVADDEGAVISALRSFFSGIQDGQFRDIGDQNDLWNVLATITARKAIRQMRVHWKQSGEGNRIDRGFALEQLKARESEPGEDAILMEECTRKLNSLHDPMLRKIALLRLEGHTTQEIAEHLSIHLRSVQRKLNLIESSWLEAEDDST